MNLYDSKSSFFIDNKRTTMFPSLRKPIEARKMRPKDVLGYSMDDKKYRMTSNQMLKGLLKKNDSEMTKLRRTFLK